MVTGLTACGVEAGSDEDAEFEEAGSSTGTGRTIGTGVCQNHAVQTITTSDGYSATFTSKCDQSLVRDSSGHRDGIVESGQSRPRSASLTPCGSILAARRVCATRGPGFDAEVDLDCGSPAELVTCLTLRKPTGFICSAQSFLEFTQCWLRQQLLSASGVNHGSGVLPRPYRSCRCFSQSAALSLGSFSF